MKEIMSGKKNIIIGIATIIIVMICVLLINSFVKGKVNRSILEENLELINKECNFVYENIDESEKKYIDLLENEEDSFKRGLYSSALVQVYAIKSDYDNIIKYGTDAVENYKKVKGGEYYAIAEKKYIAWIMLRIGNYSESFRETSELLEILNTSGDEILTSDEIIDSEALIYSIFLCIYSEFEILDKAKIYYDKLCEIEMTQKLEESKGDKISFSKMVYADKIKDINLMKKYSEESYEISRSRDLETGSNTADSVISNVAFANVKLGNFDIAFEQLQKSEKFFADVGDDYGLASTYSVYAEYYYAIGDNENSIEYYKKTMKVFNECGDYYRLKNTLVEYIKMLKNNNLEEDINENYKNYYELVDKIGGDLAMNELLSQIVDINDELNQSTLLLLEKEGRNNEIAVAIAIIVIVILGLMVARMYSLIKSKNRSEKILEKIANTDYLTEVNTRAYGERLILNEINNNKNFSMAIIDIDNFKKINDTYGHIFGDLILKEIAKCLRDGIAEDDIVARFGGEEFIVAFMNKDKFEAKEILDKIRIDVSNIKFENNVSVTFSGGIETWDNTTISMIIKKADKLLYKAKREGR
ncbi:MAG: GGDEF domain-containing protein, partial [Clostridium sp.]